MSKQSLSKPNFFIVGAPKCGTTALCEYLKDHPNVFMSMPKEPHYFAKDFDNYRQIRTIDEYHAMFKECGEQHKAVGEASVFYLRSEEAIKEIYSYNPEAKIIVMLRRPIDMIYSLHAQLRLTVDETENDFEKAWNLQSQRAAGKNIPRECREPAFLQYREMGQLGAQFERLREIFPSEQIKTIFFEDFSKSSHAVYLDVLTFLCLPDDRRVDFQRVNSNQVHRSERLGKFLFKTPRPMVDTALRMRDLLGIKQLNILTTLRTLNAKSVSRQPLSADLEEEMQSEFTADIKKIENILGVNLEHWL